MTEQAAIGRALGPYIIESVIGSGGMGTVYRGRDTRLDRAVAVKVIQAQYCDNDVRRRRFETEARSAARLAHPNVVAIYDVGEHDGQPYIVTEFVEGGTLADRLARGGLSVDETLAIAKPLAQALAQAHARGIIHRDLKPANILLTPSGSPKLSDFGLAKCLEPLIATNSHADTAAASLTADGTIIGTPAYMSPEQAAGLPVDSRSDLFSLGVILVEMLTGRRPFQRGTHVQTLSAILHDEIDYNSVPAPLANVVRRCLRKDPAERYQSASQLVDDLVRCARPAAAPSRRMWIATSVAAVLLMLAAILIFRSNNRPTTASATKIESIAILPLQDFSPDRSQSYFADAMTEELTAELASLRSLRVTSRTSSSAYRGTTKRLTNVARELNVDGLIEGSVVHANDHVRITVQLIDGRTDRHVWAQTFDRTGADILALQRDIASEIVEQLRTTLSPAEREHLTRVPTHNLAAYEAFLQAQYKNRTAMGTREDAEEAIRYAERAVALDPNFAEAWVALARGCQERMFGSNGGKEFDEKGVIAIERALAINPSLAEAYNVRGMLQYNVFHDYDIAAAIADYRRALSLNPNLAEPHHNLCSELNHLGLHDDAMRECSAALRLDPRNNGAKVRLARAQWQSNRFQDALATYERYGLTVWEKAVTLAYLGRFDDARATLPHTPPNDSDRHAAESLVEAMQQHATQAIELMHRSEHIGKDQPHFHHAATIMAAACAEIGHADDAVHFLTIAAARGMPNYPLFTNNPSLRKLRGAPAYDKFIASLKPRWEQIAQAAK